METLTFEITKPKLNINYDVIENRLNKIDFLKTILINKENRIIKVRAYQNIEDKSLIILNSLHKIGYELSLK